MGREKGIGAEQSAGSLRKHKTKGGSEMILQDDDGTASKGSRRTTASERLRKKMQEREKREAKFNGEVEEEEYCIPYDQTNYQEASRRLEEKKKKKFELTGQKTGEMELKREGSKFLINGQKVDFTGADSRRMRAKIEGMNEDTILLNKQKLMLVRMLKKSKKWSYMVRNLEINDDPVKRWVEPIVEVDMPYHFSLCQKSVNKCMALLLRCMILNPNNEPDIVVMRDKIVDKLYELRKLCEGEEDYEPLFNGTMRALIQTEKRLQSLQQGMGISESEDSEPESCGEDALAELKNTRKTMQYTIASMVKGD
jgi:hypothetical protein